MTFQDIRIRIVFISSNVYRNNMTCEGLSMINYSSLVYSLYEPIINKTKEFLFFWQQGRNLIWKGGDRRANLTLIEFFF